jgi:hypothetical protein
MVKLKISLTIIAAFLAVVPTANSANYWNAVGNMAEDFEGYTNSAEMGNVWNDWGLNGPYVQNPTYTLDTTDAYEGSKSLKFTWDDAWLANGTIASFNVANGGARALEIANVLNAEGAIGIRFAFKGDAGNEPGAYMQFMVTGGNVAQGFGYNFFIPWNYAANDYLRPTCDQWVVVEHYFGTEMGPDVTGFTLSAVVLPSGWAGVLHFDALEAITFEKSGAPIGDDFESYASNSEIADWCTYGTDDINSTIASGRTSSQAVKVVVDWNDISTPYKVFGKEYHYGALAFGDDWSRYNRISAWVKGDLSNTGSYDVVMKVLGYDATVLATSVAPGITNSETWTKLQIDIYAEEAWKNVGYLNFVVFGDPCTLLADTNIYIDDIEIGPEPIPGYPIAEEVPGEATQMKITWQLDSTQTCTLEWGKDNTCSDGSIFVTETNPATHEYEHTICSLTGGNTLYYYRVIVGANEYRGTFRTKTLISDITVENFEGFVDDANLWKAWGEVSKLYNDGYYVSDFNVSLEIDDANVYEGDKSICVEWAGVNPYGNIFLDFDASHNVEYSAKMLDILNNPAAKKVRFAWKGDPGNDPTGYIQFVIRGAQGSEAAFLKDKNGDLIRPNRVNTINNGFFIMEYAPNGNNTMGPGITGFSIEAVVMNGPGTFWFDALEVPDVEYTPVDGDFDIDGDVSMFDLKKLADDWLADNTGDIVTTVVEDFESYANTSEMLNNWSVFNASHPSTMTLFGTGGPDNSKILEWDYFCGTGYNWPEIVFDIGHSIDLTQYDQFSIWVKTYLGNSTEDKLYVKFMCDGLTADNVGGEYWFPGSTSGNPGEWIQYTVNMHDLVYMQYNNSIDRLEDMTNCLGVMLGCVGNSGSGGTIDFDGLNLVNFSGAAPEADINADWKVNFSDFAIFAEHWMESFLDE